MRENISLVNKLNELRLLLNHPQSETKTYVLVEGDSDIRLFRKLFSNSSTYIKSIPGGYANLELGLKKLYDEAFNNVIGIRDADFMHLNEENSSIPVLFLTDEHDMEMMLFTSNEALNSLYYEFYQDDKILIDQFRDKVLESIKFLAYVRWYNELNNLELNFNGIGLGDFFDVSELKIDEERCIQNLLNRSPNNKVNVGIDLRNEVKNMYNTTHSLTQVCCGHDITSVIALIFSSGLKKAVNTARVESQLRTSFSSGEFKKTNLYHMLNEWSNMTNFKLFD